MKNNLHVLVLEDQLTDYEIAVHELRANGFEFDSRRVDTERDFRRQIGEFTPDLILADHSLPAYDGLSALEVAREECPAVPFIFLSGTMGEEVAINALQNGATDFVLKQRIGRLGVAVRRALETVGERRKRHEAEATQQLLRSALEAAANAVVITDAEGVIEWTNSAFTTLTGYSVGEVVGQTPRLLKSGEHDPAVYANLWATILAGRTWRGQLTNRRKNGSHYLAEQTITPVRLQNQGITHFIGIMNDVTERKKLEEQFIQAQKMEVVGQLAGGVAHDFNNMLAVIMGYADLLTQDLKPDDAAQALIQEIRNAGERAVALTRQLLVFSRKQTMQPVVLDLNEVLAGTSKMLRRLVDESIELSMAPGKQVGRVKADSGYLGQVLMNLVVNARDAMPRGGKLTVETANVTLDEHYARTHEGVTPGEYVMLAVSDTGSGMTEEVKARIFEAFFTTKPQGKGTGLGLATCQSIVKQCGGHISVYSELGAGSTFKVYLPRVDLPLDHDTTFRKADQLPRGTETVLLVEDEPSLRHLAAKVLKAQGYEVLRANSGQDGLRVAREHKGKPIRLVVTDVIMPEMSGKVMAEWLKETYPDLKILFTSGYTDAAIAQHGVLDPGVEFLAKPYTPAALAGKVREVLDK